VQRNAVIAGIAGIAGIAENAGNERALNDQSPFTFHPFDAPNACSGQAFHF
jgi:hypothetical protein